MAFTAGIKRPQQLGSGYNQQSTYDRLVTVTGYDTNEHIMFAEDFSSGKKYKVFVNPEEVLKTDAAIAAKRTDISKINWMGHKIDKGMEKNIKVGHKCVLTRSKVVGVDKTTGVIDLEVHRIAALPSQKTDKSFQGIISMTYRIEDGAERVNRVYHWNPNALDFDLQNELKSLHELAAKIDDASKDFGVKKGDVTVTKPTIGVQFRALMKTERTYAYAKEGEPKEIWEVVDMSQPFDWIPGKQDEEGKEIKSSGHPLTGQEMIEYAEMYYNYISEHPQFKDAVSSGELKFEVCYYYSYPASKTDALQLTTGNKEKDKNADKNPLYQLCHRKCYGDIDNSEDGLIIGKNAAVNGIVALSDDKLIEINDEPVKVPAYWVSKVFANNIRGHVHAFVRTSDGAKAEPHKQLQLIKSETETNTVTATQVRKEDALVQEASVSRPLEAPKASEVSVEDFNPFEDDIPIETSAPTPIKVSFGKKM
jgi:hypothetical protein